MLHSLDFAERTRRELAPRTAQQHKSALGQFMTPAKVARFMANMFPASALTTCRLLDAGAGVGALSCAFLDRWQAGAFDFKTVETTAYEVDERLSDYLREHLARYRHTRAQVIIGDYIELSTRPDDLFSASTAPASYTHAILNPPYKKIHSHSAHRLALRAAGIETVNLYSAFVALAVTQLVPGGQLVAIIPRSFCNGPYYRPFREFILARAAIRQMHLFASRSKAFQDDAVLQENIILRLERDGQPGPVTISTSTDDGFIDLTTHEHPFERIIFPDDPERFIHVPTSPEHQAMQQMPAMQATLTELGIQVSTGPVVDFRLKDHLRAWPEPGAAPLIYPGHLSMQGATWPLPELKKPNAIMCNENTEKWLYPNGFYCVVRRFSSKEEKRRVVASVVEPTVFGSHSMLGFENHLNVFHAHKQGLPELLARGLAVFLNSSAVDQHVRRFSGHTQVNATDLKQMKYPDRNTLLALGAWAKQQQHINQAMIDTQLDAVLA